MSEYRGRYSTLTEKPCFTALYWTDSVEHSGPRLKVMGMEIPVLGISVAFQLE